MGFRENLAMGRGGIPCDIRGNNSSGNVSDCIREHGFQFRNVRRAKYSIRQHADRRGHRRKYKANDNDHSGAM